MHTIRTWTF